MLEALEGESGRLTFFNAIFLLAFVVFLFTLGGDSFYALVEMVLGWCALGGFGTFCVG